MSLTLKSSELKLIFLCCAFFFLGMHLVYYAAFLFLLAADKIINISTVARYHIKDLFALLLSIAFLCVVYINGYPNMHIDKSYLPLVLLTLTTLIFFICYSKGAELSFRILQSYTMGMFVKSLLTVLYSLWHGGESYGYGMLLDPLSGQIVNSPAYVALLSISFAFFYSSIFSGCSLSTKKINIAVCAFSFLLAIYLGGRSFFVVVLFTIMLNFILFKSSRRPSFVLFLAIMAVMFIIAISISPVLQDKINFILLRFTNSGLESPRFLLWQDAINKLPEYPFGGFSVDTMIEYTYWYHNLWFDTARLGGWLGLCLLVLLNIYFLTYGLVIRKNNIYSKHMLIVHLLSLAVMSQEVILEGVLEVFGIYLLSGLMLVRFSREKIDYYYE